MLPVRYAFFCKKRIIHGTAKITPSNHYKINISEHLLGGGRPQPSTLAPMGRLPQMQQQQQQSLQSSSLYNTTTNNHQLRQSPNNMHQVGAVLC